MSISGLHCEYMTDCIIDLSGPHNCNTTTTTYTKILLYCSKRNTTAIQVFLQLLQVAHKFSASCIENLYCSVVLQGSTWVQYSCNTRKNFLYCSCSCIALVCTALLTICLRKQPHCSVVHTETNSTELNWTSTSAQRETVQQNTDTYTDTQWHAERQRERERWS